MRLLRNDREMATIVPVGESLPALSIVQPRPFLDGESRIWFHRKREFERVVRVGAVAFRQDLVGSWLNRDNG